MDDCITGHQLLGDNYIVQPVENIPVSVIDYNKLEMSQLIHSGSISNGTPVIHLTDLNSNLKTKVLHPLEVEIQRDFELKQQQPVLSKHSISSVIQCSSSQAVQDQCSSATVKVMEETYPLLDGVVQIQAMPSGRETVLNVNPAKATENMICQISPINPQVAIEKRQFIIVSDSSMLFNVTSKETDPKLNTKSENYDLVNNKVLHKSEMQDISVELNNYSNATECNKRPLASTESDSENEEDDLEPVYDYEPDPDVSTKKRVEEVEKPNKCYMCFRSFRQKKNMYAHIRKIHSTQPKIEGGILCPLCKMHALRQEHLRNHLESLHEISIEKEEKLFNTMEEFLLWKQYIERETLSFYISKSSSKLLANNQQKTYYKCHRSGNYVPHINDNRRKKLKVQGSNKIGATCPAAMEVTENTQGINVTFWKTHVGHDNDLAHLVLSKEDRSKIMDYIVSGISWDKVLEKIKKEEHKTSVTPSRLTILSKQDLRNIKKLHDMKGSSELYGARKKAIQGRKPTKEKMLRRASQLHIVEKADILLNLLETTEVRAEFRPKICLMIDNLISTVKRRAVKISKRENPKRKPWTIFEHSEGVEEKDQQNKSPSSVSHEADDGTFNTNFEKDISRKGSGMRSSRRHRTTRDGGQKNLQEFRH